MTVPVGAAAKTIYAVLQERDESNDQLPKATTEFVKECRLMSTLRHRHIVQFLGVCFFPDSRLPALVMERLMTSLHDLLAPETQPPRGAPNPLSFFTMDLKCSVLQDVTNGLDYLHERPSPIIHRDLSARNVLLSTDMVAMQDSRPGRGSYGTSYASCGHYDQGTRCWHLHASRGNSFIFF